MTEIYYYVGFYVVWVFAIAVFLYAFRSIVAFAYAHMNNKPAMKIYNWYDTDHEGYKKCIVFCDIKTANTYHVPVSYISFVFYMLMECRKISAEDIKKIAVK